jgi:DNA polymerase-3 subunit delta
MTDLIGLALALDPGDFRQTLTRVSLYKHGDPTPLTSAEVASLAPATIEAEVDDLIHATAEGRAADLGPLMRRLEGQGTSAVTICIAALRHFRALHAAACDPGKPRLFGPRREASQRQATKWGARLLEQATALLIDTSPQPQASARELAAEMGAAYLPLPRVDATSMSRSVQAATAASANGWGRG